MIRISDSARNYFRHLLAQQDIDGLSIRMKAVNAGTPKADCVLEYAEAVDLAGDEVRLDCDGFDVYVEAASAAWLTEAEVDYQVNATGGQLTIRAPHIKGTVPADDAPLGDRVQYVLDSEINPQIAAHGGRVRLVDADADGVVLLQFGGGCHGCGMADVTLKQGIEKTLRSHFPEITAVRDATDHASGNNPYFRGQSGASAVG
ncbi:MAG: NfuA family Fe-S biogenesis protein [Rudaea sp.]|uniref:NfuA family Fe-S biogenesis protein n=1 Tax=unclassified Rudaea TaxID=2627037 RepID=UPI0010FA5C25|nr:MULTISPECIES: NfuA family Fe-S biogenesis protein [unclassified Rudaea]MBN8884887.1 NfuA family Fe-S biogenesis protein [Rudaea sp.]MBR0344668.1 NfuA family Fe-S biogenesis protein [Rudaea sp.]